MEIKLATDEDLPHIINLFKVSLGEAGGIPKEEFWRWKHEQNPFGKSPTILAWEGNKLIGLRAFLKWRYRYKGNFIQSYRAVDTATHPDYRGRGIFSTLTLKLIEQIKQGDPCFIFNTPNQVSKPGYLKMGWKVWGKTPLLIKPCPFNFLMNRKNEASSISKQASRDWEDFLRIEPAWNIIFRDSIVTDTTLDYLKWRYKDVPGINYGWHHAHGDGSCLLFYRLKPGKFMELRITDVFFDNPKSSLVKKAIAELVENHKPHVVTILRDGRSLLSSLLPFGFIPMKYFGLTLTYREVNDESLMDLASHQDLWYFSAGSIELL